MLHIYGSPLSSPTNKIIYVANYLNIPFEFSFINLAKGEHLQTEFLQLNPYGKIPAIDDEGFKLAESNAIIRYLDEKNGFKLYPQELQARAKVNQWLYYVSQHLSIDSAKIMFNTYFYKFVGLPVNERALQEGRHALSRYLPVVEQQLSKHTYFAGETISLADFVLLATADVFELCQIDFSLYPHFKSWQEKMMQQSFYKKHHESYTTTFNKILGPVLNPAHAS